MTIDKERGGKTLPAALRLFVLFDQYGVKNRFPDTLKELRRHMALKQTELAAKLQTTQRKVSYWESGRIEPDLDALWQIADYFD
ncbi:MAG: helix-turn-helix domain-containing protein, partial [Clostridiales bacterium]|nr:helix-turn-helix domain-containing protein [Clostridiales bacterium]